MKRVGLLCGVLLLALAVGYAQSSEGWTKYEVDTSGTVTVRAMVVDSANRVYIVRQEGAGLPSILQGSVEVSLLESTVQAITVDAQGTMWGCIDGVLWKRTHDGWQKIDNEQFESAYRIAMTHDGSVWFAIDPAENDAHLVWWDGAIWNGAQLPIGMDKVTALAVGKDDAVWVGTPSNGLFLVDKGNVHEAVDANFMLPSLHIRDIQVAANGDVWVATEGGIGWYNGEKWKIFNSKNSDLPSGVVSALTIDQRGSVWALTKPLAYYRYGTWRTVPWSASMTEQYTAMVVDRDNSLWVAGHGGDVFMYRGIATDVEERSTDAEAAQIRTYPNPFADGFSVSLHLRRTAHVEIALVDIFGKQIAVLADKVLPAGRQTVQWNGNTVGGMSIGNGVYYCRIVTQEYSTLLPVQKMFR